MTDSKPVSQTTERNRFLDALYMALREHDVGNLPGTNVAIGALDLDHSAIIARVEAILKDNTNA